MFLVTLGPDVELKQSGSTEEQSCAKKEQEEKRRGMNMPVHKADFATSHVKGRQWFAKC